MHINEHNCNRLCFYLLYENLLNPRENADMSNEKGF